MVSLSQGFIAGKHQMTGDGLFAAEREHVSTIYSDAE